MLDNYPLIPDEAFLFFPSQNDIKPNVRKIFGGSITFQPNQIFKIKDFDNHIAKNRIPIDHSIDDSLKLRFLQSCGFNIDKTVKSILSYIKWRNQSPREITPKILNILKSGVCYMCGRDVNYRPIIVVDVKKIIKLGYSTEDLLLAQGFFFSYIIDNVFIEGQIQNWVVIIDLGFSGVFSVSGPFKKTISFLSDTFRCRMFMASVINCSGSISMIWGMAKGFIEQQTQKKISFQGSHIPTKIMGILHPSQLQVKYGGKQPNITNFWPPAIHSHQFRISGLSNLVTIEQYKMKYERGQLSKRKINKKFIEQKRQTKHNTTTILTPIASQELADYKQNINAVFQNTHLPKHNTFQRQISFNQNTLPVTQKQVISNKQIQQSNPSILSFRNSKNYTENIKSDTPNFENRKMGTNIKKQISQSSGQYLTFEDDFVEPSTKPLTALTQRYSQSPLQQFPLKMKIRQIQEPKIVKNRIDYVPIPLVQQRIQSPIVFKQQNCVVRYLKCPKVNFKPSPTAPPIFDEIHIYLEGGMQSKKSKASHLQY